MVKNQGKTNKKVELPQNDRAYIWVPSIFMRFRDIAAFVLQHAIYSHPTSIVSPKFPHVHLESRWMACGLRRAKVLG